MAELNIQNLSDFVKNAEILWTKAKESIPQIMRTSGIVREMSIPMLTGNTRDFTEIDLEEYATGKSESEQADRAKVQQGFTKIGTLKRIAKEIGISYEMRSQGKYPEVKARLTNLAKLGPNRIDLDLSHRFTFGIATTYVDLDGATVDISTGDGLPLFDTAHLVRGSATTFRNRLAGNPQFSRSALESMEQMRIENCINQFGEKMFIKDDILWTTDDPNTMSTVKELLRSTSNPDGSATALGANLAGNPGIINTFQGRYTHKVLPRVATTAAGAVDASKNKYWGTCSSIYTTFTLGMHEEPRLKVPPVEGRNNEEFSTDDWTFGMRAGYMIVIVTANWTGFSSGDLVA